MIKSSKNKLFNAIDADDFQAVKQFIEAGEDVHAIDEYCLRAACSNGNFKIVKLLLENGANIETGRAFGPVERAISFGNKKLVQYLLKNGGRLTSRSEIYAKDEKFKEFIKNQLRLQKIGKL
jgi:ankyrin repeat protein